MNKKMTVLSMVLLLCFAFGMQAMAAGDDPVTKNDRTNMNMNNNNMGTTTPDGADRVRTNDGNIGPNDDVNMRGYNTDGYGVNAADDATDWSWLGLLGLIGLAGLFGRNRAEEERR